MQHRGAVSSHGLVFFCIVSLFVLGLFAVPALAQDPSDPIADQTVRIEDNNGNGKTDALGPIAVADCTVARDATIVVEDAGGTQLELINGDNVTITGGPQSITIEATDPETTFATLDPAAGETGKVISSTGITCGDTTDPNTDQGNQADDAQYRDGDKEITVLVDTIPDKKILVDTGGPPVGMLLLAATFVGFGVLMLRRT